MTSPKLSASSMMKDEHRWRAESDLRTLMESQEIHRDKGRLKSACAIAGKQLRSLRRITGRRS
jgi:hypothetical protein